MLRRRVLRKHGSLIKAKRIDSWRYAVDASWKWYYKYSVIDLCDLDLTQLVTDEEFSIGARDAS